MRRRLQRPLTREELEAIDRRLRRQTARRVKRAAKMRWVRRMPPTQAIHPHAKPTIGSLMAPAGTGTRAARRNAADLRIQPRPLRQALDEHVVLAAEALVRVTAGRNQPLDPTTAEALDALGQALAARRTLLAHIADANRQPRSAA